MPDRVHPFCCILATFVLAGSFATADEPAARSTAARNVKQIVAHRGASAERPENTLAAFRRAIDVGATATELDVRTTQDGHLVLSHDATLDRTTTGSGNIHQKTLAEIQRLDAGSKFASAYAGEKVPTLAEALAVCRGKIDVLLDLKETGEEYAAQVADVVRSVGEAGRTIVGVRSVEQARQFRRLLPQARQIGLIAKPEEIESYARAGVETIRLWPQWLADPALAQQVKHAGCKLHLNGVTGTTDEVTPLLAFDPDSLSSDDPRRLMATLSELQSGNK